MFNAGTSNAYGLSDGGAIHIDHSTGYVEIAANVFHDIRAKVRFLTEILDDFRRFLDEIWRF